MNKLALALSAIGAIATSSPSLADRQVQFIEGAPKDRFVLTNIGDCALGEGRFEISFANSNAGLIFDVTAAGAGVEVFQPFEVTTGAQYLTAQPSITDGAQRAVLDMSGLSVNEIITFTIDVDDTGRGREITVADGEISGTSVSLYTGGTTYSAVMEAQAKVSLTCSPEMFGVFG